MTEAEARAWFDERYPSAIVDRVTRFLAMVVDENGRQNLIAPSTVPTIWQRHAVDSAQLLTYDRVDEAWLDIGTGGGFPGMIVALLRDAPVIMVEPRARRAAFLSHAAEAFGLSHAQVIAGRIERQQLSAGIISARALSALSTVFENAVQCADMNTRWVLPRGRSALADMADARRDWTGLFHVEHSIVESDAGIVVVEGVKRR